VQVLMTELATDRARTAAALLETRAHEIVTCGDDVPRTVTCAALRGGSCPLDRQTIDVVLHVERADGPGLADEGVVCALRRFVPLVVAARGQASAADPFVGWAAAVCDLDELEEALTEAAAAPLPAHSAAAARRRTPCWQVPAVSPAGRPSHVDRAVAYGWSSSASNRWTANCVCARPYALKEPSGSLTP
jgi:hypothetical protein